MWKLPELAAATAERFGRSRSGGFTNSALAKLAKNCIAGESRRIAVSSTDAHGGHTGRYYK